MLFNSQGWLIEQQDRNGNRIQILRDSGNRVTGIIDPAGRRLELTYTTVTRDGVPFPVIASITDPIGRQVRYGYDILGRLTTVTDPSGGITRYTYDTADRMVSITDARGITYLTNEYDTAGRVIKQTQADAGVYTFRYTLAGSAITQTDVTDPMGDVTIYRFNNRQYIERVVDATGQVTRYERDFGTGQLMAVYVTH